LSADDELASGTLMAIHEIVEAPVDGDLVRLSTASLRHVYNIQARRDGNSFALLSAWQEGERHEVNLRNSDRLRHQLRSARLQFVP
jgi:hypothetical protein